ncbi:MAG: four helix bundle protein [Candidatus Acidiferrales bacterium]
MNNLSPVPPKKKIESYQDLLVWQKSMDLVTVIYKIVIKLPLNEQYGLASQLRRAAVSIPANIAEGFGRWHAKEFVRFLLIANGSVKELETHLLIGVRLGFISPKETETPMQMTSEISKMIFALRDRLSK